MPPTSTIEEHIPRLRRYARALMGDRVGADDLVQDTLERAWGRFHLWESGTDLRAWLFSIMHNLHVNQVRAGRLRAADSLDDEDGAMEIPVRATQEDGLMVKDLDKALRQLSEEQREVLLLVGLEQLSYEEVAQVLSIPLGTVMSRLSRGREKLRALLSGGPVKPSPLRVVP